MSTEVKFKAGDRIRVVSSDSVAYNYANIAVLTMTGGEKEYGVVWDSFHPAVHYYKAADVDNVWELDSKCPVVASMNKSYPGLTTQPPSGVNGNTVVLPTPIDYIPIDLTITENGVCSHVWAEYNGFNESFKFCQKCDEKRK